MAEPGYGYQDVLDAYAIAVGRDKKFEAMDIPTFSRYMNQSLGTTRYKIGEVGPIKAGAMQASLGLDDLIKPAATATGEFGESLGALVGPKTAAVGKAVGESIPRTAAELALVGGGFAAGGVPGVLLAGAGAGSAGSRTLAETGSVPASALSAGLTLAAPTIGNIGGKAAVKYATPALEKYLGRSLPLLTERIPREVGEQVALLGAGEGVRQASSVVTGQGFAPITAESVGEQLAFNVPFLPFSVPRLARGYRVAPTGTGEMQARPAGMGDLFARGEFHPRESEAQAAAARGTREVAGAARAFTEQTGPQAAFTPEQLMGGTFGLVSQEQLSTPKPYGVARLPGDFLPGNSVLERMPKTLSQGEYGLLKDAGIEQFLKDRRVHVDELNRWIQENGPKVEVHSYSQQRGDSRSPEQVEYATLQHELDTLGYRVDENDVNFSLLRRTGEPVHASNTTVPADAWSIRARMSDLFATKLDHENVLQPTSAYDTVSPKPTGTHPVERVDVVLPTPRTEGGNPKGRDAIKWQADNLHENLPNTLGWAAIQYDTVNGEKVAHVFEVQSRWGQSLREAKERSGDLKEVNGPGTGSWSWVNRDGVPRGRQYATREEAARNIPKDISKQDHPLLADYNRLILKSAVQQAIKQGARKIVLSDAETAMMTEGHDVFSGGWNSYGVFGSEQRAREHAASIPKTEGEVRVSQRGREWDVEVLLKPSQEPGMRLNYDQILPKVLEELTGVKGERVSLGEHKNATKIAFQESPWIGNESKFRDNLIFKNPDGSPKTDATGLAFDLDKVKRSLLGRGGFTLFGKDKIATNLSQMENEGSSVPAMARSAEAQRDLAIRPGETLADAAAREVGLPQVVNAEVAPGQFLATTQAFFDRYFDLKGEVGPRKELLSRSAVLMAARFEKLLGRTRLAEVLQGPSFFAPARESKFNALIGLRTTKVLAQRELESLRVLWDGAHEMMHGVEALAQPFMQDWTQAPKDIPEIGAYIRATEQANGLSVDEKQLVLNTLVRHAMPGANEAFGYKEQVLASPGTETTSEFLADFGGLIALGASSEQAVASMKDYIFFNDKPTSDISAVMVRNLTQSLTAVKDFIGQQLKAAGKDADVQRVLDSVQGTHDNLVKVLASERDSQVAYDTFRGALERMQTSANDAPPVVSYKQVRRMYDLMGQQKLGIKQADVPDDAWDTAEKEVLPSTKVGGIRASLLERFLPMTQFAAYFRGEVPEFERATQTIRDVPAMASQKSQQMWQHWVTPEGKWDSERISRLGNMNNAVAKAFSDIALFQNAEEGKRWTKLEIEAYAKNKYPSLTDADISAIDLSLQQAEGVHREAALQMEQAMRSSLGYGVARILMQQHRGLLPDAADRLGLEIANTALDASAVAPERMIQVLQELRGRLGNDVAFQEAQQFLDKKAPLVLAEMKKLHERPGYFSEVRPGKWLVAYKSNDGVRGLEDFATPADAQKRIADLQKKGGYEYVRGYNKEDTRERWRGVSKSITNSLIAADKAVFDGVLESLQRSGADVVTLSRLREEFTPGDGAARVWTPPYMQERQFVAGREKLNMMEQMLNYVSAVSYGTARRHTREKVELISRHPNLRANPAMQNSLQRYTTEMLDASGKEWQSIKNFLYFNTLGYQLASGIVNTSQNFMVGAPLLMRYGANIGEAYKRMAGAVAELGKAHIAGGSVKQPKFANEEHSEVIRRAEDERVVDKGFVSDYFALDDELEATRRSITAGSGNVEKARNLLSNSAYHLMKFGRDFFMGYTEQFNQRAGVLAGYDFARQKLGKNQEDAYLWAKQFVQEANFGGGRYNRPEVFNGLGKGFGTAGLVYTLSGYTFNLLGVYARLAKDAVARSVPHAQQAGARKALATALTGQVMMGGVMGLPAVAGVIAVLEQLFPDTEIKKNLREGFTSLGGGDTDMGHFMGDFGMSGVLNATTSVDVGSRFQLGTFMGVDPYNGFKLENLAGPIGGLIENMVKASQQASTGEWANAAEKVLPSGVRGLWRMANQEGGMRNAKGQLLFEPTGGEQALAAIGFRPKRLAHYHEEQALTQRSDDIEQRRLSRLYNELADELLAGRGEAVRTGILKEATEAREQGEFFDPISALKRIVEVAQARSTSRLDRGSGIATGGSERSQISRLFPQGQQGSEVGSLMARTAVERTVPLPGAGRVSVQALREAQMVDQLRATNPQMTVEEARRVLRLARPQRAL